MGDFQNLESLQKSSKFAIGEMFLEGLLSKKTPFSSAELLFVVLENYRRSYPGGGEATEIVSKAPIPKHY